MSVHRVCCRRRVITRRSSVRRVTALVIRHLSTAIQRFRPTIGFPCGAVGGKDDRCMRRGRYSNGKGKGSHAVKTNDALVGYAALQDASDASSVTLELAFV